MKRESPFGIRGYAELIQIFAVVSNSDINSGNGRKIDVTYHEKREEAKTAAIGVGPGGSDGGVEPRLAIRFEEGDKVFLMAYAEKGMWDFSIPASGAPFVEFSTPTSTQVRAEMSRKRLHLK